MSRQSRRGLRRPPEFIQEAVDEQEEEQDDEQEAEETSLADLVAPADAQKFDKTFNVTQSEESFSPGDAPAIPRPWQGIPRVAVVYNLNYVYDDSADEWVRDTGNSGGGGGLSIADTGTVSVTSGFPIDRVQTNLTDPTATYFPVATFETAADPIGGVSTYINPDYGSGASDNISYQFGWNEIGGNWEIVFEQSTGSTIDVRWTVYEPPQP